MTRIVNKPISTGTRLEQGARGFVTCRKNARDPSSDRGVWLPRYPECEGTHKIKKKIKSLLYSFYYAEV